MPNEEQLKEIAEEVSYEWEMLLWAFGPLCREMGVETASPILTEMCFYGTTVDNCIGSALLEVFLLHVRNIRDFLYEKDRPRDDDVLATQFFVGTATDWPKMRPDMRGCYLDSNRGRLDKSLAHITYPRLKYREDKTWKVGQIKCDLDAPWNAFLNALPKERRSWFRGLRTSF